MKYIYKTVSLEDFLSSHDAARIGVMDWQTQKGMAKKASKAIESLINYYAEDGWEYVRSEEFRADFFKSGMASFFNDKNNPLLQMFIFRQERTDELIEKLKHKTINQNTNDENNKVVKGIQPKDTNAKCPCCESLINSQDESCWKCNASFDQYSSWKPKPI